MKRMKRTKKTKGGKGGRWQKKVLDEPEASQFFSGIYQSIILRLYDPPGPEPGRPLPPCHFHRPPSSSTTSRFVFSPGRSSEMEEREWSTLRRAAPANYFILTPDRQSARAFHQTSYGHSTHTLLTANDRLVDYFVSVHTTPFRLPFGPGSISSEEILLGLAAAPLLANSSSLSLSPTPHMIDRPLLLS